MAISERRLVGQEHGHVSFRWKDYRTSRTDNNLLTLPGVVQHILPPGLPRERAYGLLANQQREQHQAQCRELLATRHSLPDASRAAEPPSPPTLQCPNCGSDRWEVLVTTDRPRGGKSI